MRRIVGSLLIAGMLGVVAIVPAGASVRTKALCDAIRDGNVGAPAPPQSTATTAADAKKSLKLYKKFQKADAPKGVKRSLKAIVAGLEELADGTPPAEVFGADVDTSAYGKAAAKFSDYVFDECVKGVIDDLPGDFDADIPDLP